MVKAAVERKELLDTRDDVPNGRCMEAYKEEKRRVKRFMYQSKKEV